VSSVVNSPLVVSSIVFQMATALVSMALMSLRMEAVLVSMESIMAVSAVLSRAKYPSVS